jgi:hypothetical protein
MWSFQVTIPFLPPSSNHIYQRRRQGGQALTAQAVAFRERFNDEMSKVLHELQDIPSDGIRVFVVTFDIFFETLINSTFDGTKEGAKCRYKKLDVTRRVTFLEDCFHKAIDVDDLFFFGNCSTKHMDPNNPRVEIFIVERSPEEFGIPPLSPEVAERVGG